MPPIVAAGICATLVYIVFQCDRERKLSHSRALWVPILWFFFACSRGVSQWLGIGGGEDVATQMMNGSPVDRLIYSVLLVVGLVVLANRKERTMKVVRQSMPIALFFGFCLLSLLWSDFPDVGFKRWNKAIGDWIMVLIVWTDQQPVAALKRLLASISYTLIPLSILFIKYYGNLGRSYGRWLGEEHLIGVTTDKNMLGAICLAFGLASVWRLFDILRGNMSGWERKKAIFAQGVVFAIVIWLLSLIDAMTSLVCFVLGSHIVLLCRTRLFRTHAVLLHFTILAMIVLTASIAFLGLSPGSLKAVGRNSTLTERTDIWAGVIRFTDNPWVGAGYESFWLGPRLDKMVAEVTRWWVPNESHNGYLEIWANLGWVGCGLLGLLLLWGYCKVIGQWRREVSVGGLLVAYFVTGVIFNFTEAAFFRMMTPTWLFLLLALNIPRSLPIAGSSSDFRQ